MDGDTDGLRHVNFFVGVRASVAGDGRLEAPGGYLGWRCRCRRFSVGAIANGFPNFGLDLIDRSAFAHAGVNDGIRGGKLRAAGPAAVLDTENVEGERRIARGNDPVLADDTVLFAAADEFAREEQERTATAIDQHKLVDGSAGAGLRQGKGTSNPAPNPGFVTLLADRHFASGENLLARDERVGCLIVWRVE